MKKISLFVALLLGMSLLVACSSEEVLILKYNIEKEYVLLGTFCCDWFGASHLERFISCRESHQNYISNERKITLLKSRSFNNSNGLYPHWVDVHMYNKKFLSLHNHLYVTMR